MTPKTTESKKNGNFSESKSFAVPARDIFPPAAGQRFKGQKSSNSRMQGVVTSMGFESSPKMKKTSERLKKNLRCVPDGPPGDFAASPVAGPGGIPFLT